jgi:hypothetical protein
MDSPEGIRVNEDSLKIMRYFFLRSFVVLFASVKPEADFRLPLSVQSHFPLFIAVCIEGKSLLVRSKLL